VKALVVGSFNQAKAAEMAQLLRGLELSIRSLRDFPAVRPVAESGATFAENARQKALGLARQIAGLPAEGAGKGILGVVADDSGLEVDALGGRPGVRSARYVSESATDPERVQRLLEELDGVPAERRTARFRCHVALADAHHVLIETRGTVEGRIAFAPAGAFGFGYDPVFIPRGYDRTFGEIGADLKPRISHRALALREFRERLKQLLDGS
jgi:XTP/dITP diphosphohydrolase